MRTHLPLLPMRSPGHSITVRGSSAAGRLLGTATLRFARRLGAGIDPAECPCPFPDRAKSERTWHGSGTAGFQQAIEILEQLVRELPDVPDYRFELGDLYSSMVARQLYSHGWRRTEWTPEVLQDAEENLMSGLDVTKDLDVTHPNIPRYLMLKARLHHTYAKVLNETNRLADAERQYQRAIEKQRLVVRHAGDGHHHEIFLARYRFELAEVLFKLGQTAEARTALESLNGELEALLDDPASCLGGRSQKSAEDLLADGGRLLRKIKSETGER